LNKILHFGVDMNIQYVYTILLLKISGVGKKSENLTGYIFLTHTVYSGFSMHSWIWPWDKLIAPKVTTLALCGP